MLYKVQNQKCIVLSFSRFMIWKQENTKYTPEIKINSLYVCVWNKLFYSLSYGKLEGTKTEAFQPQSFTQLKTQFTCNKWL